MTRLEKIKLAIEKGYTYDEVTGKVYGVRGKEITSIIKGYITIGIKLNYKTYRLAAHQFGYYIKYGRIVDYIDHKDGNRTNNKIDNLREVTNQQNTFNNKKSKGYYFNGYSYCTQIVLDNKNIYLGSFITEQEARKAYLDAKKIYHII